MKYLGPPQSGSQADTTASHNRAGQYYRNRRSPVQPVGTGRRAFMRSAFGAASSAWAGLSPADQASWNAFAASYPVTDSLGQSITLTGHQMYVSINAQLINCGQAPVTDVPADTGTLPAAITVFTVTAAGVITLTIVGAMTVDDFYLVSFSKPVSAGVTFNKTYWQQTVVAGNSVGGATFGTAYVAQFGTIPAGKKVFVQLTPVNQYGVTGVPVTAVAVTT